MNQTITKLFGVSAGGLFVLLALHGAALLDALAAIPSVLDAWSKPSAIGAWAVLAGVLLPLGTDLTLERWTPRCSNHHARRLGIEIAQGLVAVAVVFSLIPSAGGALLALGCAMFAPLISRALRALAAYAKAAS